MCTDWVCVFPGGDVSSKMDSDQLLDKPHASEMTDCLLAQLMDDLLASPWCSSIDDDDATCSSSINLDDFETVTTEPPQLPNTCRRKKKPTRSPKDEIVLLRRTIKDLEQILSLKNRRQSATREPTQRPSTVRNVSAWRGVAARQLQLLCDSQHENHRLRDQVQHQLSVLTRLRRLARRVRVPVENIPPMVAPVHTSVFYSIGHELLVTTSMVFATIDVVSAKLSSRLRREEFCDSMIYEGRTSHSGSVMAESSVGRIVPQDASSLAQALWEKHVLNDHENERYYRMEYVDQVSNSYVVWFYLSTPTPYGLAVYHGVRVRTRKIVGKRVTIVLAGSLWPDASTPFPFNAVAFNGTAVTIFQPQEEMHETTEPVGEVLMHNVFSPLEYAVPLKTMTREQVTTLQDFVIKVRDRTVDETQNLLDSLMLQQS